MPELHVSNHLLGDRDALEAAWNRDGYWFFRDVIDKGALSKVRDAFVEELARRGIARRDDPQVKWTGARLEDFSPVLPGVDPMLWRTLVAAPAIHQFFREVLVDEPFWLPITVYRAVPPAQEKSREQLAYVHQDGFANAGIPLRSCWLPLADIDEETGGLAVAQGQHRGGYFHDLASPPRFDVPHGAVPAEAWRRADYRPGDVVIFHPRTPHSGLANTSDRFRLSLDIRVVRRSDRVPAIGTLVAADGDSITLRTDAGDIVRFSVDDRTFCRDDLANRMPLPELLSSLSENTVLIVGIDGDGHATVVRPTHN